MKRKNNKGFTLAEILFLVAALIITFGVVLYGFWILTIFQGNFWVNQSSALSAVQFKNPDIVKVVKLDRNVYARSIVVAEDEAGTRYTYRLDSSILWDHDVEEVQDE